MRFLAELATRHAQASNRMLVAVLTVSATMFLSFGSIEKPESVDPNPTAATQSVNVEIAGDGKSFLLPSGFTSAVRESGILQRQDSSGDTVGPKLTVPLLGSQVSARVFALFSTALLVVIGFAFASAHLQQDRALKFCHKSIDEIVPNYSGARSAFDSMLVGTFSRIDPIRVALSSTLPRMDSPRTAVIVYYVLKCIYWAVSLLFPVCAAFLSMLYADFPFWGVIVTTIIVAIPFGLCAIVEISWARTRARSLTRQGEEIC